MKKQPTDLSEWLRKGNHIIKLNPANAVTPSIDSRYKKEDRYEPNKNPVVLWSLAFHGKKS